MRLQPGVERVEHDAGLDRDRHRVRVEGDDAVQVLAVVDAPARRRPSARTASCRRRAAAPARRSSRQTSNAARTSSSASAPARRPARPGRSTRRSRSGRATRGRTARRPRPRGAGARRVRRRRARGWKTSGCGRSARSSGVVGAGQPGGVKCAAAFRPRGRRAILCASSPKKQAAATAMRRMRVATMPKAAARQPLVASPKPLIPSPCAPCSPLDPHPSGRHFLQIPGPTNVPDRVLRAIDHPTIDHRGPEFARAARKTVLAGMKQVFQTEAASSSIPASGTGAWEAALVNTLSPGDRVLMVETGHFATLWQTHGRAARPRRRVPAGRLAARRRSGAIEARLARRPRARDQGGLRRAQRDVDRRDHPHRRGARGDRPRRPPGAASWSTRSRRSASIDYRHDEWGVDVTVGGSQKGLMLPPGLSFNAISDKALAATQARAAAALVLGLGRDARDERAAATFPYTPATNLLYGLHEALDDAARGGPRPRVRAPRRGSPKRRGARCARWGLEILCAQSRRVQRVADGGDDAGRPRRRRVPQDRARPLRHVAGHRGWASCRARSSASAISATSTT